MGENGYPVINVRGEEREIIFSGAGTQLRPYLVETEEHLYALASGSAKNSSDVYYKMTNDIEVTAALWTPIGTYMTPFKGIFDGDGHKITGIMLDNGNYAYAGLFGVNAGTINNLSVDVKFDVNSYYVGGLVGSNTGSIDNCSSSGTISGSSTGGYVGGLVGYNSGSIDNCFSSGTISGKDDVGGLVGKVVSGGISNSGSSANVSGDGSGSVGGFVGGYGEDKAIAFIKNCYATGDVSNGYSTGGFIGRIFDDKSYSFKIYNCYARGNVSSITGYVGGFCGCSSKSEASIDSCYSTGVVNAEVGVKGGAFAGPGSSYSFYTCYYNRTTAGQSNSNLNSGVTGLTTEQMKKQESFTGFDFDTVWAISPDINDGYPYLVSIFGEPEDTTVSVTGVTLDKTTLSLNKGDTATLTATVAPSDASDTSVTWVSSAPDVVSVDNGVLTAVSDGTATITVTTVDGGFTAECTVTVTSSASSVLVGDANGDGDVDFVDAITVLKHDAGVSYLTGDRLTAADTNNDGDVDFVDAIQILKFDSGLISSFN